MASPRTHLRRQLTASRKATGNNYSIWLFYSHKLQEDIALVGDCEVLHWVTNLEPNPKVASFKLGVEVEVSAEEPAADDKFEVIKCTKVLCLNGAVELHRIFKSDDAKDEVRRVPVWFKEVGSAISTGTLVDLPSTNFYLASKNLGFWVKVIAFASQVRSYNLKQEMDLIYSTISVQKGGDVRTLLASTPIQDTALALGAMCQMILSGTIKVEASVDGFGNNTRWSLP